MTVFGITLDRRTLLLVASLLMAIGAAIGFHLIRNQRIADVLAVIDITGSMNARDMGDPKGSQDRLEAAKSALVNFMQDVPCESRLGLGVFSERISYLLFEPAEICNNYDAMEAAIAGLDWRMAWEGDSYIAKGLYSAIEIASSLKSDLIFMTDGQEAPPTPLSGIPEFDGKPAAVKGIIVGVGGSEKIPIPKFDDEGRQIGVYSETDVPQENRVGPPPKDAETREGYNPRNAPFGAMPATGDEQLTSVKTAHLEDLARITGLHYAELQHVGALAPPLKAATEPRLLPVNTDMSYVPAIFALALLLATYALSLVEAAPFSRLGRLRNFRLTPHHREGNLLHAS
ncbi:VWA domain-containing protein [Hyphomicrobium sp.]|uniref:vWA domain-containing protein n=1 Tax=Hyphomicrobium sp. TaxID=82 RepID=UPI000FC08447|nr:vWA domain-containing protein [Hyphomicrobium sp.]RUO98513.1 MAG: VWA domain-containing protein [Hyphomicrobium sp.]